MPPATRRPHGCSPGGARDEHAGDPAPSLSKRTVLWAVTRRACRVLEATLVPALIFFVAVTTLGPIAAMIAVLAWGYGAIIRRVVRGSPIRRS